VENWIDEGNKKSNNKNSWKIVNEYIDEGNWGKKGKECGGKKGKECGGKKGKECGGKKDKIITWGGPIATFRWDDVADVDFKFLSVREIDPLINLS
jgi:hypothetical protein